MLSNTNPLSHTRYHQDVCIELEVQDVMGLPATVKKLLQVVSAAPRMEAWIGQVSRERANRCTESAVAYEESLQTGLLHGES